MVGEYGPGTYYQKSEHGKKTFQLVVIILDQEKGQGGMKKGQGGRSALSLYQKTEF